MLKHRVIGTFVAVWCAVCLSYVGVRTALGALTSRASTQAESVGTSAGDTVTTIGGTANADESTALQSQRETEDSTNQQEAEEGANQGVAVNQAPAEGSVTIDAAPQAEDSTVGYEAPQTEAPLESEVQTQDEEVFSAPSLSEYLSQYTCGSCRRNCSLDNPHCHNGSRLAELKAQEYYETYG